MSERNYSTDHLVPSNVDPCSIAYRSPNIARTRSVRSKQDIAKKTRRAKLRKVRLAFARSVKWLFGIKPRRPSSFVMPYEYKNREHRSSTRSRPSPTRLTNGGSPASVPFPIPSVYLTRPSNRRRSHYRVHSYGGVGSQPMAERNTVRFSHPVVNSAIVDASKSCPALLSVDESAESDEKRSSRTSIATEASSLASSPNDSGPRPVQPKAIWRWSAQSVTVDGSRESYTDFKNRLDGHKPRADRYSSGNQPPSLQFIPRMGTIKLHEEEPAQTSSTAQDDAEIEKHRSNALSSLEGSTPQMSQGRYVLAILPRKDLPITAVQIPPDQYPSSLIPGSISQDRPAMRRPHTFAGPASSEQNCQADTPPLSPSMHTHANRASATKPAAKRKSRMPTYSKGEERLDLSKFASGADPDFSVRRGEQYKRVESSVFDEVMPTPTQPDALTPRSSETEPQIIAESSFLLPPTPPPSGEKLKRTLVKPERKEVTARKPALARNMATANTSKPLPPTPGPRSSSKLVTPISMNANGYPNIAAHPSKRFSAEPKYQRRTMDVVETKYTKEHPKKPTKPKKVGKTSKLDGESSKLKKKSLTEEERKRLIELETLDEQLKKLMCV